MIDYFIGLVVIGGCAYMSHRGQKRVKEANEIMQRFHEDCKILGNQLEIDLLAKSYGLVCIRAHEIEQSPDQKQTNLGDTV